MSKGIVICGGGYSYFANAFISIQLLRKFGCDLPIELWMTETEYCSIVKKVLVGLNTQIRVASGRASRVSLPTGARWQWFLKPFAIVHSEFRNVMYLDADSFAVADPSFLFCDPRFSDTGAIFWPDVGVTPKEHPIWKEMGVPYRYEPEFESGQILTVAKVLGHAIGMNERYSCSKITIKKE
jgi:alpha 1,2-mannosyltransferase